MTRLGSSLTLKLHVPVSNRDWREDEHYVFAVGGFDPALELGPLSLCTWLELQTLPTVEVLPWGSDHRWHFALIIGDADAAPASTPQLLADLRNAGWFVVWFTHANPWCESDMADTAPTIARRLAMAVNGVVVVQPSADTGPPGVSALISALEGVIYPLAYGSVIGFDVREVRECLSSPDGRPIHHYRLICNGAERNIRMPNADEVLAHTGRGIFSLLVPPHYTMDEASIFYREVCNRLSAPPDVMPMLAITADDAPVEAHLYVA